MTHHALVLDRLTYCVRNAGYGVGFRFSAEYLVKGELAGDGRGGLCVQTYKKCIDFFEVFVFAALSLYALTNLSISVVLFLDIRIDACRLLEVVNVDMATKLLFKECHVVKLLFVKVLDPHQQSHVKLIESHGWLVFEYLDTFSHERVIFLEQEYPLQQYD